MQRVYINISIATVSSHLSTLAITWHGILSMSPQLNEATDIDRAYLCKSVLRPPKAFNALGKRYVNAIYSKVIKVTKLSSSYHLCVEYFSQLSFDSEMYTISAAISDFVG